MKKLLILSLVIFAGMNFYSCNDVDSDFQEDINAAELYKKALKSENQMDFFLSLNNKEKAAIWSHKYDLALNNYEWTSEQRSFISTLKNSVTPSIYENPETISTQDFYAKAIGIFSKMETEYLLFNFENYKDGQELQSKGRFWGWTVEVVGDCGWYETNPGVYEWVAPALFDHYVFFVRDVNDQPGVVPCNDNGTPAI